MTCYTCDTNHSYEWWTDTTGETFCTGCASKYEGQGLTFVLIRSEQQLDTQDAWQLAGIGVN